MKDITTEEAVEILKKDLEGTKKANECGLATKGEFNKEIEAIEKVLNELEKKDKIIGEMIDDIMKHYQIKTIRKKCCPTCKIGEKACTYSGIHRNCIKQYFERKVENGN